MYGILNFFSFMFLSSTVLLGLCLARSSTSFRSLSTSLVDGVRTEEDETDFDRKADSGTEWDDDDDGDDPRVYNSDDDDT
jgi:hypothetical protein